MCANIDLEMAQVPSLQIAACFEAVDAFLRSSLSLHVYTPGITIKSLTM